MKKHLKNVRIGLKRLICDIKSVKWALILIGASFFFLWITTESICPMYGITGFPCPGCGLTRAGLNVLTLNFSGAWQMNPFIFPIGTLILIWCVCRYILLCRPPAWLTWCSAAVFTGLLIFYVCRMITEFPGEAPMDYYADNLLRRVIYKISC